MSSYAKILSLTYNSAEATKSTALKTHYRSVRLVKDVGTLNPLRPSYENVHLLGRCIDPETRNLYVFYIDTYYNSAWIIEINIDKRRQNIVYYDKYNAIGFDIRYKIHNPRVVHGRLVWTDGNTPIYQMDIRRAKKSFELKIGYGQHPTTLKWNEITTYGLDQIVANGNKYYKSVTHINLDHEPKTDDGTNWLDLNCLIEDAYYSMNIENFYFEPIPPNIPPEVSYFSDETRKINNLRQTLFQFAYRYVYIDWRKSTFSPASIVPVPQAEEQPATGVANEVVSLNNKLQVIVRSGGEEVRAVEVVARSSSDPSKWYLVETISKLVEQERSGEISRTAEPESIGALIVIPAPTVLNESIALAGRNSMGMTLPNHSTVNSYIGVSSVGLSWAWDDTTPKPLVVTCPPGMCYIHAKPSWVTVLSATGYSLLAGMTVQNGEQLSVYPNFTNRIANLYDYLIFANVYGDTTIVILSQPAYLPPPPVPITPTMLIDPTDSSGLTLEGSSLSSTSQVTTVSMSFVPNHPAYQDGQEFTMYWRAVVNGVYYGNGSFAAYDRVSNTGTVELNTTLVPGDTVIIYVSADYVAPEHTAYPSRISMGISVQPPSVLNAEVNADVTGMAFLATASGIDDAQTTTITCPPTLCTIVSKPAWVSIKGVDGYDLYDGWTIRNGELISVFPSEDNPGSARSGYINLANAYGDTDIISVSQAAAEAPPAGVPVDCSIIVNPSDGTGLSLPGSSAYALSGQKNISWSALVAHSGHAEGDTWTMYWRIKINNIQQGSGSFDAYIGTNTGELVADINLNPGDTVVVEFSSITF